MIDYAIKFSEEYPRKFIRFPSDWEKEAWEPGEINKTDGSEYLVPFILDDGPKAYKKEREPEEEEKWTLRRVLKYGFLALLLLLVVSSIIVSPTLYNSQ